MTAPWMDISWGVVLIVLPLAAGLAAFLLPWLARPLGLFCVPAVLAAVAGLGGQLLNHGVFQHSVGGWGAPLGIDLYADGLSVVMLGAAALVGSSVSVHAASYFKGDESGRFWPLWMFLLSALNALFLSADLFNLYVTLEMVGLASVSLTALTGGRDALGGAMRYILAALLGALFYLLGVALLYHSSGTVDIDLLARRAEATPALWAAAGLMTAGLMLKTALFPLHFWLPPAHASAPAPVSALLSGLVIKASFYILLRLWLELFGPLAGENIGFLPSLLGAAAVLWGSAQALRQSRLKLLVAYSTVAQIGYLFLAFPLAAGAGIAWSAVVYLALSHAIAKTAMFLAAGNMMHFGGHDRIADLDRPAQRLPLSVAAFGVAGVSIMGLPPSGGFVGKWLLLQAALAQGRWDLAAVMITGSLLAAGYVFKVIGHAFTQSPVPRAPKSVPAAMEWAALLPACGAVLLGFLSPALFALMGIGDPFGGGGERP